MMKMTGLRFSVLLLLPILVALVTVRASAVELTPEDAGLRVEPLGRGVYAVIGQTGGRTRDNLGMNANFGFIDTPEGVILIDSGASAAGAALLDRLVRQHTGHSVRRVINTGSQDHRWLGNGYFAAQGAEIIALKRTATTQQRLGSQQIASLRGVLGDRLDGTETFVSPFPLDGDTALIRHGGVMLELRWLDNAHFPGDIVVLLPERGIMFAGDHIYIRRLLGILPESDPVSWLTAFRAIEKLDPAIIVPGHGPVCSLQDAQRDTGEYLAFIVNGVRGYAEELAGVEAAVSALSVAPAFTHLEHFGTLHRSNISNAYLRLESK